MLVTLALAAIAGFAGAQDDVLVIRKQLALEELHTVEVDANTEYILDFTPSLEQSQWPVRVWVSSDGGDTSHPLLLTHRQRAGAGTWQVPARVDGRLLHEFERTLCPDDSLVDKPSDCDVEEGSSVRPRGWFSVHVAAACARAVRLRAEPARDWRLSPDNVLTTHITLDRPRVHHYRWEEGQESVRLVVSSDDDVCATVAVQNYTCPIAETLADIEGATIRMTVQRSGAVHLSRDRYPLGFLVVGVVHASDVACAGAEGGGEDWLWAEAVLGRRPPSPPPPRLKALRLHTRAALSRGQYALGALAALALAALAYGAVAALVLAQRIPRWRRLVAPKAVLAPGGAQAVAETRRRRRRDSAATFDSSDNSNTESDEEAAAGGRRPDSARWVAAVAAAGAPGGAGGAGGAGPAHAVGTGPTNMEPTHTEGTGRTQTGGSSDPEDPNMGPHPHGERTRNGHVAFVEPNSVDNGGVAGAQQETGTSADGANGIAPAARADGSGHNPTATESTAQPIAPAEAVTQVRIDDMIEESVGVEAGETRPSQPDIQRPFGLPARLRLAALSRRKARVLRARSDRYLHTLATVAVFYALPVVQFVAAFQIVMNVSGSLDLCYYNFLCAHPLGQLADFNHVFSNVGYLLLGALFMLQLKRRQRRRRRKPRHEEYGIPPHYGLLSSLGAGMMVVALLSASYHICPNRLNFQFDTSFMYVLAVLSMVKIYQARHPDVNARAHATFAVLALLIATAVWGVLGGGALFWAVFTVLHVFTFLLLSLRIYYLGQFRLEKASLAQLAGAGPRPLYSARLLLLLLANALNWLFALYGLLSQSENFASHLLFVLLGNTLVYMVFYVVMKLVHGERLRWYSWAFVGGAAAAWAPALYYFTSGSSSWASTPAHSRHRNHECRVLEFYDAHDLWHMLSALALYLTFNVMLTWDDGLAAVPRSEIAVF